MNDFIGSMLVKLAAIDIWNDAQVRDAQAWAATFEYMYRNDDDKTTMIRQMQTHVLARLLCLSEWVGDPIELIEHLADQIHDLSGEPGPTPFRQCAANQRGNVRCHRAALPDSGFCQEHKLDSENRPRHTVKIHVHFITGQQTAFQVDPGGWWKYTEPHEGLPRLIIKHEKGSARHEFPVSSLVGIYVDPQ